MKNLLLGLAAFATLSVSIAGYAADDRHAAKRGYLEHSSGRTSKGAKAVRTGLLPLEVRNRNSVSNSRTLFRPADAGLPAQRRVKAGAPREIYPTIAGSVIYSSAWTASNATPGLSVIPTSSDKDFENKIKVERPPFGGAIQVGDDYYMIEYTSSDDNLFVYVRKYDLNRWKYIRSWSGSVTTLSPGGMTVDPTSGIIYGIFYTEDRNGCTLSTISFEDDGPVTEVIGRIPDDIDVVAVASDSNGQLYAISRTVEFGLNDFKIVESTLNKLDKNTGTLTPIGETGMYPYYTSDAVIDHNTGKMYWTVNPKDNTGHLCEVDLATGKATVIYTFPDDEEVNGLFIMDPLPAPGAPESAVNLSYSFPYGDLDGKVSFDIPAFTFDGNPASGDVEYTITVNGGNPVKGISSYGSHVEADIAVPEPGDYVFRVTLASERGIGRYSEITGYVGVGMPVTPRPVLAVEDGIATVTWEPVKEVVDNGYINPDQVTYTVIRYSPSSDPDKTEETAVIVADNISETVYTERLPKVDNLSYFYFTVQANYRELQSAPGKTEQVIAGEIRPPYMFDFNTGKVPLGYTVVDGNGDGLTWVPYAYDCLAAWYNRNMLIDLDEWLISPRIYLEGGKVYPLNVSASAGYDDTTEVLEVLAGKTPDVEGMTMKVLQPTNLSDKTARTFKGYIAVKESGYYYLGFHAISPADQYTLNLYGYSIEEGTASPIPATPELTAVPEGTNGRKVTVSVKLPENDLLGNPLESISSVVVSRDGSQNRTTDSPLPGSTIEVVYNNVPEGLHSYSAVVKCGQYQSAAGSVTVFSGISRPDAPASATINENGNTGEVTVAWTPVDHDIYGKELTNGVTYNIYRINENGSRELIESGVKTTEYRFRPVGEGSQAFVQVGVTASNSKGEGSGVLTDAIAAGTPYSTPWSESFLIDNIGIFAITELSGEIAAGVVYDDYFNIPSQDGDEMYLGFIGDNGDSSTLITGKLDLTGLLNPGVSLFAYSFGNDDTNVFEIYAGEANTELKLVKTINMGRLPMSGWNMISADLSEFAGKTIQLGLRYVLGSYGIGVLDNLRVRSLVDCDLTVFSLESPLKAVPSRDFEVKVGIHNDGVKAVEDFNVNLYVDGNKYASHKVDNLQPEADEIISFSAALPALAADPVGIYAEIEAEGDVVADNNVSQTVNVKPVLSTLPPVTDLKGETIENSASLSWTEPDTDPIAPGVTEYDFEDELSFVHSIDDWKFVDVDRQPASAFKRFDIPGIIPGVTPTSFFVFDCSLPIFNETFAVHSGTKCLATMWRYDEKQTDDWLITPKLSGEAQTVSFYARSYNGDAMERFTILCSSTDREINSFQEIDYIDAVPEEWTQFTADVPEGTKYLAVRSSNSGGWMLFIDDFEFIPAPEFTEFSLIGYNVYADGVKATTTEENEYLHSGQTGSVSFAVTALYDKGESRSSNVVVLDLSGVDGVDSDKAVVTATDGMITVAGADGRQVTISTLDGKVLFSDKGTPSLKVVTGNGVFIVSVDGKSAKIIVK